MKRKLYIGPLGRNGDIMQILPALSYEYLVSGIKPRLMVAVEFFPLLMGCSYLEPVCFNGHWTEVTNALAYAKSVYGDHEHINCCTYGQHYRFQRQSSNYQREIWRLSQCPEPFQSLPLAFTKRDKENEPRVVDGPYIVVHFGGVSSPFFHGDLVRRLIAQFDISVVDFDGLRFEHLYDSLTLLENAEGIICSDSAFLHLARAVPDLPMIAFLCDGPADWNVTQPPNQAIVAFNYKSVPKAELEIAIALNTLITC